MLGASESWIAAARGSSGKPENATSQGAITMLYTIAVILLIAWLLGLVGTFTLGPILHVLLVVAAVLFIVGLLNGRRTSDIL